jgi:hypothetical protein
MECKACRHPDRDAVDHKLVAGVPLRDIVASTGLSLGGLVRHKEHLRATVKEAWKSEREEHGSRLAQRAEHLLGEAESLLAHARTKENLQGAVSCINACSKLVELLMRASGELQAPGAGIHVNFTRTTNNVVNVGTDDFGELARLVQEATDNFSSATIERMRLLVSPTDTPST